MALSPHRFVWASALSAGARRTFPTGCRPQSGDGTRLRSDEDGILRSCSSGPARAQSVVDTRTYPSTRHAAFAASSQLTGGLPRPASTHASNRSVLVARAYGRTEDELSDSSSQTYRKHCQPWSTASRCWRNLSACRGRRRDKCPFRYTVHYLRLAQGTPRWHRLSNGRMRRGIR